MSEADADWTAVYEGSRLQCDLVAAVLNANGVLAVHPASAAEDWGAVFETSVVWVRTESAAEAREIIAAVEGGDPGQRPAG